MFWTWAQSPLGATIVGGVIVLLLAWIVSRIPRLRKSVFGFLARPFKWIGGLRVSTLAQRERTIRHVAAAARQDALGIRDEIVTSGHRERAEYERGFAAGREEGLSEGIALAEEDSIGVETVGRSRARSE